jgi:hypothetical protein
MPSCCYADEYGELFTEREARRTARRFERKGLRGSALLLADHVTATGIAGVTILEVGGGVGHLHAELLRRGAARAVNVELSPSWEAAAAGLLAGLGLRDRVERRIGDFVEAVDDLPDVDVVLLHRVICCYPDWQAMVAASAAKARRVVALTLPVERWASRAALRAGNGWLRLRKRSFQAYIHPTERITAALHTDGFRVVADSSGPVWRTIVAQRAGP